MSEIYQESLAQFLSDPQAKAPSRRRYTKPRKAKPSQQQPAGSRTYNSATTSRDYAGHELAPYTGRPGSLDHLLLPSRVGNTLHFRSLESIKSHRNEHMPA